MKLFFPAIMAFAFTGIISKTIDSHAFDATDVSCYGYFYDIDSETHKDHMGNPVNCYEDMQSASYTVYWNQCTGGDELIGFNVDNEGNKQYCSNSLCSMDDRKRGQKILPTGISIECGFSTPRELLAKYRKTGK